MPRFKIFAGLGGGFGGKCYQYTTEDGYDKETATEEAYQQACDIFENQIGNGIEGYEDWRQEAESNIDFDEIPEEEWESAISEYMDGAEAEARESWIDYAAVEVKEGESEDDDDYEYVEEEEDF